ncbi:putative PX domain-containing protein kinase-like protein [Monocercomonoides exilis]|uniref:putative PX domain-containing protein kinase-like protein n=1 Tax=Monocercomonoides exilis TaxID=2049356 RepID=UPI00355ACD52|nr:putative PX domain-containing protein kinase-like protein [Monocercomonoides exilis]|eukprot:MONOS_12145.1-p1 / transcript=MONOS_12145.1 / gene=MONOS_12145 / organism=Monocercomonoides_exilis_PA203 / gene_product=unspecified product / transcript_product=unspecified product / location=Mono_scaffold00652:8313-10082(-) / protein_length=429 / sequence_SO=supercontig / SO=protein_coding / is_pseudo=false
MEVWLIATIASTSFVFVCVLITVIVCCCRRSQKIAIDPERYPLLAPRKVKDDSKANLIQRNNQAEIAVQLCLRSIDKWEYSGSFGLIGTRLDKHYFQVTHEKQNLPCMAQLIEKGEDCTLLLEDDGIRKAVSAVLTSIRHPHIIPCLHVSFSKSRGGSPSLLIITPIATNGSLRDMGCSVGFNLLSEKKLKKRPTMSEELISEFLFQILEAVLFLRKHHYQCGHITSSNILIQGSETAFLTDYWNSLLGVSPRPQILRDAIDQRAEAGLSSENEEEDAESAKKVKDEDDSDDEEKTKSTSSSSGSGDNAEQSCIENMQQPRKFLPLSQIDPDVLSFAVVAYEMASGFELTHPLQLPTSIPTHPLLHSFCTHIFSTPHLSLISLLLHPFFKQHISVTRRKNAATTQVSDSFLSAMNQLRLEFARVRNTSI